MNHYLIVCLGFLSFVLLLLLVEYYVLRKATQSFVYRIIVNGTRGKSSVTAYLAAGLRANGVTTFAKITGIVPTIISGNDEEQLIKRRGAPRVHEQFRMIRLAAKKKAQAIVLECMSLHPENQRIETKALRPTLYVITNIGDDHFEEMGKTQNERIASICSAIPANSTVITIADENLTEIRNIASSKNTRVLTTGDFVKDTELPDGIFCQNINLALTALQAMGLDPEAAIKPVINYAANFKNPVSTWQCDGHTLFFVNGFAVNDPPSAAVFIDYWRDKLIPGAKVNIILNTRADRPGRTRLFCLWLNDLPFIERILITGNHSNAAARMLSNRTPGKTAIIVNADQVAETIERMAGEFNTDSIFIGIGNIAGSGFKIIEHIESKVKNLNNDN